MFWGRLLLISFLGVIGGNAYAALSFGDFVGLYQIQSCSLTVDGRPYEGDSLCDRAQYLEMRALGQGRFELSYFLLGEASQREVLAELRRQGENFVEQARFVQEDQSVYWFRQYREFPVIYALDEWREWILPGALPEGGLQFVRFQRELRGDDVKSVLYRYQLRPLEAPSRRL